MNWTGTWRNQYGSELSIAGAEGGALSGTFRTALKDSVFFGRDYPVTGIARGTCVSFSFGVEKAAGGTVASFTGMMLDDVIETMWMVVSHKPELAEPWPHAVVTNHDTFARVVA
jgi:hypothetical protein